MRELRQPDAETDRADAVIDRAHLRRMTLGNGALEGEVLRLFAAQLAALHAQIARDDGGVTAMAAHTIKGSARSIGAPAVAHAAEAFERATSPAEKSAAITALSSALSAAEAEIARLLEML